MRLITAHHSAHFYLDFLEFNGWIYGGRGHTQIVLMLVCGSFEVLHFAAPLDELIREMERVRAVAQVLSNVVFDFVR